MYLVQTIQKSEADVLYRRGTGIFGTVLIAALFIWFISSPGTIPQKIGIMTGGVKQMSYSILKEAGKVVGKDIGFPETDKANNDGSNKNEKEESSPSEDASENMINEYSAKLTGNKEIQKIIGQISDAGLSDKK